jgi:hypothetical protein
MSRATIEELRAKVTEAGPWFDVPADAKPARCRGCDAMIYFVVQPSGKAMPVNVLVVGGVFPRREHVSNGVHEARVGRGVSHFGTCPAAADFRGQR